jgi:hypothetical protein
MIRVMRGGLAQRAKKSSWLKETLTGTFADAPIEQDRILLVSDRRGARGQPGRF